jgi:KDO2-lipid IV(A) lauroyltransferase
MSSIRERAEYLALRAVVAVLEKLSWERAGRIGARIGALGYRPLGIRRGIVERQIAAAFPERTREEVMRIARGAYEHLGRSALETALVPTLGRDGVLQVFEGCDGWEFVQAGLSGGKGLIIVTGHLGNWELAAAYTASRGVPLDAIVRGMANKQFDAYLNSTRTALGVTVVHDSEAVRRTPRSFRENRAVAFVADQGVKGLASTFVNFFGRPAKTPRGPAVFALRLGVPVVFGTAIRMPSGRYRMFFEEIPVTPTGDREKDVDRIVADYTGVIEKWVRKYPEQYFWHHRRWRRQPPDTPEHLREP